MGLTFVPISQMRGLRSLGLFTSLREVGGWVVTQVCGLQGLHASLWVYAACCRASPSGCSLQGSQVPAEVHSTEEKG